MEIFNGVLALHIYSLYASGFLMFFYLTLTQGSFTSEFNFIRRIRLFLPVYYIFLAIVFFTGLLLLALKGFVLNTYIMLMIATWLIIFFLAIFQFILFKRARRSRRYNIFRGMSFFILLFDIFLLFAPYVFKDYF
ncbi:hypothetical protein DMB92_06910 [Campylobacter sp. MIT 99-7217]|nr:hypothetical protein [Campylobacter sp. MIT 99-7217]TQR30947.1 hypothetical protein DMB92_06910 [Campylobacter sp. MIT 99-7217]